MNRPDGTTAFEVDPRIEKLALDLMDASRSITLEVFPALQDDEPPPPDARPLARFNFVAGTFASGREWAADILAGALNQFEQGCPRHRRSG